MTCLDELKSIRALELEINAATLNASDSEIEKSAFIVAGIPDPAVRKKAIEIVVRCARQNDNLALEFLAWLLVYRAVPPLQVLQAIVYSKDRTMLEICGTQHFEEDSIRHLGLYKTTGTIPSFEVKGEHDPILVDFLAVETNPDLHTDKTQDQDRRHKSDLKALTRKSEQDQVAGLKAKIKGVIMGSMSAEEIAHKISRIASKKTNAEVVSTLVQCCIDEKSYNRLYGNIVYKLIQQSALWVELFQDKFATIYAETGEDLDTNQINNAGAFFGHLLGLNALNWTQVFSTVSLDPGDSTPSNRIFLQAVMEELRREVGLPVLEKRLANPALRSAAASAFTGEFAAQYWNAIGFQDLAKLVAIDSSSDSSS